MLNVMRPHLHCSRRALVVLFGVLVSTSHGESLSITRPTWGCYPSGTPFDVFQIETLALEKGHFLGAADYRKIAEDKQQIPLEGIVSDNNRFWPRVVDQVANGPNGNWEEIKQTEIKGTPATFAMQPGSPNIILYLDLEPFRSFINKMKCGRVVLQNGHSASFELKDLQALSSYSAQDKKEHSDSDQWSNDLVPFGTGPSEPYVTKPLVITALSSKSGKIRASCMYATEDGNPSATVEGSKTSDGSLWLFARAQVANDYRKVWVTLGNCTNPGTPTNIMLEQPFPTLNHAKDSPRVGYFVDITIFRPRILNYRYGRVVLSNGMSAVFELKDIVAPAGIEKPNVEIIDE